MKKEYRIDLHSHCKEGSGCARSSVEDMIRYGISIGLNGLALTNHDTYLDDSLVNSYRKKYPDFKIYNGIEVAIGWEHLVCIGRPDHELFDHWDRSYEKLMERMHKNGCFVILAHPYRFHNCVELPLDSAPPDGVEMRSLNTLVDETENIRNLVAKYKLKTFGDSDAHCAEDVGICHNVFRLSSMPETDEELAEVLRSNTPEIAVDEARIRIHNEKTEEHEKLIREFIAAGGTPEEYQEKFGRWRGFYDRVADGKSYCI